ncbi:expressed unknown protein [Seminavis robusta]|uniref:Uncharacterized protein n=1 Tax=Seminavis robusta TaxID=568900 RepID=A0A9N8HWC0_9STRA|nr:expressed unknown protein [Seminavis robusta]|eukprot:Sro2599_g332270.1 n/a (251) ;mRNA; f:8614-9366
MLVERPYSLSRGLMTLSSFTLWAWALEGIAFWLLGYIALTADTTSDMDHVAAKQWMYRIAAVLWEIAAPTSLLVSSIVKHVLWPHALQGNGATKSSIFKHPNALLEHNLNSLAALIEVGFLGGLPVRRRDASFAVLFGLTYVAYTYGMVHSWPQGVTDKKKDNTNGNDDDDIKSKLDSTRQPIQQSPGPQFIYPFFDTTLPGFLTTYFLLGLLAVLLMSHLLFSLANVLVKRSPMLSVPLIAAAVCRFRD